MDLVEGVEDIQQSLHILLSTGLGERQMREEFGADLSSLQFAEIEQGIINQVTGIVEDAVLYHEPRIALEGVDVSTENANEGYLTIRIDYTVRGTNSRFNLVYPFYVKEGSRPQPSGAEG